MNGYVFLSFAKNMGKTIGKNIIKSLSGKYSPGMSDARQKLLDMRVKDFLIMLNNLQQMHLKLLQKESFKKHQKQLVIRLIIKLLIKSRKPKKFTSK